MQTFREKVEAMNDEGLTAFHDWFFGGYDREEMIEHIMEYEEGNEDSIERFLSK